MTMEIHVLTVFPQLYRPFRKFGMLAQAIQQDAVRLQVWSLRRFTDDDYGQIDDRAYGGGRGMVMKPEPYFRGVEHIRETRGSAPVLLTDPGGEQLTNKSSRALSNNQRLIILTGRYEGIDQRVRDHLVDEAWSVGPYVTPGGDLPALAIITSAIRFLPGVVGNQASVENDSYEDRSLDTPHYTRPARFRGLDVPEVLRSGDHERIQDWRRRQAIKRTSENRPNLLDEADRSPGSSGQEDRLSTVQAQGGTSDEEKN